MKWCVLIAIDVAHIHAGYPREVEGLSCKQDYSQFESDNRLHVTERVGRAGCS